MKSLYLSILIPIIAMGCQEKESGIKITEYVNPFIGTAEHGHCFPGAIFPFGAVQLSPDNPRSGWDWCSGYHYSDSIISSFSLTHLSGTGIGDLQDIRFLPVTTAPDTSCCPRDYIAGNYALFSHNNEKASPGYYSVLFDNGIKTELSVTRRCGLQYYQYPEEGCRALTIDLTTARNWDNTVETCIRKVNNRTIEGFRKSSGWAGDQQVYFTVEFSQDCEILAGKTRFHSLENGQQIRGLECYLWVNFGDRTNKILAKVSISPANTEGAHANLEKELSHWDFDKVKQDAVMAWQNELEKIKVEGKNKDQLTVFYTALYHTFNAPYTFSDVNGNYKGPDGEIHSVHRHTQYTVFSLWDTYRAAHPLFTITQKKRVGDMVNSMLKHYDAYGLLPVWELAGNETNCMIGNHSIPVIVEAWMKGIRNFDVEKAYEAMKKTVLYDKAGMKAFRTYRYIPYELENESVSKTLEYAYDDWCIAQLAKALGKEEDYRYFLESSRNYTNLFDPATGFMRGKSVNGEWKTPFSPLYSKHRDDEYTEGNAWQYSWSVQQDIEGLIALHGGQEAFEAKLDSLFTLEASLEGEDASPDISGLIGQYAHGNEPSHHIAYLFNYVNRPHKTQFYVNKILTELYHNTPDGLCGNEDCGQMSAWYVFSAMGFYPVNPVEGKYQLAAPLFDKITLKTGPDKKLVITADKESDRHIYVKEVSLNGKILDRTWITHDELVEGGELHFTLTDTI